MKARADLEKRPKYPIKITIRSPLFHTSQSFTWQRVSSGVDLNKDGLTLQAILHSVDTDVV